MAERICEFPDCGRPHNAKGLCVSHTNQMIKDGRLRPLRPYVRKTCSVEGCENAMRSNGLCPKHRHSLKRHGDPLAAESGPLRDNIWRRVDASGDCWQWTGDKNTNKYGLSYGIVRTSKTERMVAHKFIYLQLVGEMPEGLQLDHLCRNTLCVNPDHLEPVTALINVRRCPWNAADMNRVKTHCKRGHEYSPENTRVRDGSRQCVQCHRLAARRRYQARKAAATG